MRFFWLLDLSCLIWTYLSITFVPRHQLKKYYILRKIINFSIFKNNFKNHDKNWDCRYLSKIHSSPRGTMVLKGLTSQGPTIFWQWRFSMNFSTLIFFSTQMCLNFFIFTIQKYKKILCLECIELIVENLDCWIFRIRLFWLVNF